MNQTSHFRSAFIIGFSLLAGLSVLGYLLGSSLIQFKELDRTVTVKGLAEREVNADLALWPIQFLRPHNQLDTLYQEMQSDVSKVTQFLLNEGFDKDEISISSPAINDKLADNYGNSSRIEYRYTARQTLTVYSKKIDAVLQARSKLAALGQQGVMLQGEDYGNVSEFLFTGLNTLKPEMIEEATHNARQVANKFAADSNSSLGKIKWARQGQFSISPRDSQTPHIKKVRVVSTVEYYLVD